MMDDLKTKVARRVVNGILKSTGGASLYVAPGHFYSPIVNPSDVNLSRTERASDKCSEPCIDEEAMDQFFAELSRHFEFIEGFLGLEAESRYKESKKFYGFGDAYVLASIIASARPKRFIEIGSGYSSACALDVAEKYNLDTSFTFIEPYPSRLLGLLRKDDVSRCRIVDRPVQSVSLEIFRELEENDILFIDSSHIMKTASDVNYELFEILPSLKSGVIIHFHDIFAGWEYPESWIKDHNRSWNEIYALRAFLMYNDSFRVMYFNDHYWKSRPDRIAATPLKSVDDPGGGIYLRKQ